MAARPDISIVTSGHDVADARLHRLVAALDRAGQRVEVLGLGLPDAGPPEAECRTWPRAGQLGRLVQALRWPWRARGRVLVSLDPDSALGCGLRRLVLGPRRLAWVAESHEDYVALLEDRSWAQGLARHLGLAVARAGARAARRADLTVVVDDHLMPRAHRRLVSPNLPDLTMLPPPGPPEATPRAIYVGDIGLSRGLMTMLELALAAPTWRFDLIGPVNPADQAALDSFMASHLALASRLRFHGRMPPRQAWALARGAWVGLSLLENTKAFAPTMPSKIYEYLACGLPVLTSPLERPAELVERSGAGAVVGEAAEAARVLEGWSSDAAAFGRVLAAAAAQGQEVIEASGQMDQLAGLLKLMAARFRR
ncbi:MAG: glycosyltransferase [Micrococcales bacterium]|nr:glycosyltransferase [Micrococcales bacterium]